MSGSAADRRPLTANELRWIEGLIELLLHRALVVEVGGTINGELTPAEYPLSVSRYVLTVDQAVGLVAEWAT